MNCFEIKISCQNETQSNVLLTFEEFFNVHGTKIQGNIITTFKISL